MTVRTAELTIAILLAICSILLMTKSAELRIDWIPERGPGSGAWPFWLSSGMLLASLATIYRWFRRITPESNNMEPFMTRETLVVVGISAGSIFFLLVATHLVGIYIALF
ncbi:MAG: tripartite tricarboxylate transporter TctB family protein, partial [Gammaproteobacteria bacterium]|nr:tripartite tricarboxylate transporter TctB family protein [Gammaproteobacteria bacterium]